MRLPQAVVFWSLIALGLGWPGEVAARDGTLIVGADYAVWNRELEPPELTFRDAPRTFVQDPRHGLRSAKRARPEWPSGPVQLTFSGNGRWLAAPQSGSRPVSSVVVERTSGRGSGRRVPGTRDAESYRLSPGGSRLAFTRRGWVYVARVSGGRPARVARGNVLGWSTSGWIALGRGRDDSVPPATSSSIWVVRPDAKAARQVTSSISDRPALSWSPDGRHFAIAERAGPIEDPEGDVSIVDLATGSKERLEAASANAVAWSPDGHSIAFARPRRIGAQGAAASQHVYAIDVTDRARRRAASLPATRMFPREARENPGGIALVNSLAWIPPQS